MEIGNSKDQFDLSRVMAECKAYIDAINDFEIEIKGKIIITEDRITVHESRGSAKIILFDFLFNCQQETYKGMSQLIQFLRDKRTFWEAIQGETIQKLNEKININSGIKKEKLEQQKERFLNFYHHNYTLIDLFRAQITDSPLSELQQSNLKRLGLDWIVNGQPLLEAKINNSEEVFLEGNDLKIATVPAVALMLVYLDKTRYFMPGTQREQIRNIEAPRFGISSDSLYNNFLQYKNEEKRIKAKNIPHIKKAILLLEKEEWGTAAAYAKADLSNCQDDENRKSV